MLRKFLHKLGALTGDAGAVDPSEFEDPVAHQTNWGPAKTGGASFCTHNLARVSTYRVEFRATIGAKVFYTLFLVVGVGVLIAFLSSAFGRGPSSFDSAVPLLVGLVFSIAGGCMLYFGTAPIVVDKSKGYFWKGWAEPKRGLDTTDLIQFAVLEKVHALQLVSEYCQSRKNSYYSYELNMVLKDGSRVNVIDHGNLDNIRKDGRALSAFLQKPLWDAT